MTAGQPTISVIVASRHRPAELGLCLCALALQDHRDLEIVVVADPAGLAVAAASGVLHKPVAFDDANIATARNLGINAASGQVLAFVDDDAVAEPSWAGRLARAVMASGVVAATGTVLGSNGISQQWGLTYVDKTGLDHLVAAGTEPVIKLLGTNMAFRADALRRIGGFDPAFRFYLDDADASRRIAQAGQTVFVADAVVLHGFAPSAQRRADRVPRDLTDIGRSAALFLRRHGAEAHRGAVWLQIHADQTARLTRHLTAGRLDPAQSQALLKGLEQGWATGWQAPLSGLPELIDLAPPAMLCADLRPRAGVVLAGRVWSRRRMEKAATLLAGQGKIVTVICLSPGFRPHRHRFDASGFWIQTGGVFGWSDRNGTRIVWQRFKTRIRQEVLRLSRTRPVGD